MAYTKFITKIIYSIGLVSLTTLALASAQATSTVATSTTVSATSTPVTISSSTPASSTSILLTKYNHFGNRSDEVLKLQSFLNKYEGESLPTTGYYHNLTKAAVKRFQVKYSIAPVSGMQHVKTTAKINEIYNKDISKFVLAKKVIYKNKAKIISSTAFSPAISNIKTEIINPIATVSTKVETTNIKIVKNIATSTGAALSSSTKDMVNGLTLYGEEAKNKFTGMFKGFMWLLWLIPILLLLLFPRVIYNFFTGGNSSLFTGTFSRDDIEKIEGIGPKLKSDLYEFNVTSFEQISKLSTKKIKELFVKKYGQFNDVSMDTWKEQATLLFEGKTEQFEELVKNLKGGRRS